MAETQGMHPVQNTALGSELGLGKSNTDSESRAITILEIPGIDTVRHAGAVTRVFGFAQSFVFTDSNRRLRQENWPKRGLYIHYEYLPRARGVANLIVSTTTEEAREAYLRILERLSRRKLEPIQEVFAS